MPKLVINAFLAAEDKNFYEHGGLDFTGIARAALNYAQNFGSGRHPQGASTITQQVAKNFLLSNEVSFSRKIKEALLALKIERTYQQGQDPRALLERDLSRPRRLWHRLRFAHLFRQSRSTSSRCRKPPISPRCRRRRTTITRSGQRERALERRNWVIDQMAQDGFIKAADAEKAKRAPLGVTQKPTSTHTFAAEYFAEEVRRELYDRYGEKKLYEGGLSVRTTLDTKLSGAGAQGAHRRPGALRRGARLARAGRQDRHLRRLGRQARRRQGAGRHRALAARGGARDQRPVGAHRLAAGARAGRRCQQGTRRRHRAARRHEMGARPAARRGDQRSVRCSIPATWSMSRRPSSQGQYRLHQIPEVSGAMVVEDPWTGRVLAMVGGFSYDQSQFNRATQALRQPGSSFKPIVYAAALDNGYTPSTLVLDAPIEIDQGPGLGVWKPENYENDFYGPSTLRFGIEHSRNVMTVRLAQDIGMPLIAEYAKRFGVYDDLPPYLSFALGAGETTLLRMVTAYGMFDNGGRRIKPTLIDRIQDRYGHTVYRHDERECIGCDAKKWENQPEPSLIDRREQVLDPMTAYQITSMMEGVVQRGTAAGAGFQKEVGKPVAGKTGTTNDEKDAWFIGFTPDIVVRRLYRLRQAAPSRSRGDRRSSGGADREGFHESRARRQAGGAVPRAARHQADPRRPEDRPARRARQREGDPGSLQARHRAAGQLFGGRLWQRQPTRTSARTWPPFFGVSRPTPTAPCARAPAGFIEPVKRRSELRRRARDVKSPHIESKRRLDGMELKHARGNRKSSSTRSSSRSDC